MEKPDNLYDIELDRIKIHEWVWVGDCDYIFDLKSEIDNSLSGLDS